MNPIAALVSLRASVISPRLKLILSRFGSLILLFQRSPIVQFLFPEANIMGGASLANSFTLAVTTVVGLGAYDSVAGQTTIDEVLPLVVTGPDPASTTAANAINVPATVSAALNFKFKCSTAPSTPKSWKTTYNGVANSLPAGLTMKNIMTTVDGVNNYITGTPTVAGTHAVTINVYRSTNQSSSTVAQLFNICVLGFSTQPAATTTINSGGTVTLSCVATGKPVATTFHPTTATLTYEWYQGTSGTLGTILGTSASFTTPVLTSSTNYWVRIKSVMGASTVYANSNTAAITVNAADTTPPTVTINQKAGQADPTNTSPINFTVVFSEAVTDFATGDVTITGTAGGTKTATVTGSGTTYNVAVTGMTTPGTVIASLAAGVAHDAATNASTASTSTDATVTYDATAPTVTINQTAAQADPTTTSPINYTVVFSEAVTDFATGDVSITGTTSGTKTATVTGSGTTYNVAVNGMTSTGTVIASLASGVAHDAAGNASAASTSTDATVTLSTPFDTWASALPADQRGANQTPQHDGVDNLTKYAFNLDPTKPDARTLTVGAGNTAGQPGCAMVGGKLRLEFLRRKAGTNPGITYIPQFSSSLGPWVDATVVLPPTSINTTWERVVIDDPSPTGTQRFGRLKIAQP